MDSGRKALLEKAREFGSLAHTLSWNEILSMSVTYRTLALNLGIQKEWWEEFQRSFSFASDEGKEQIKRFYLCCKARYITNVMDFLSCWFGKGARVAEIPAQEFRHVYSLVMGKLGNQWERAE